MPDFGCVCVHIIYFTRLRYFLKWQGDMDTSARINGIATMMESFNFLYGIMLGEKILHLVDNLSRTLQHKDLSASEGQVAARLTVDALWS